MKKLFIYLIISALIPVSLSAGSLSALFTSKTFYSPESGSYVEAYLSVNGSTVVFKEEADGKYSGSIQITYIFSNEKGVVYSDKYNLLSQPVSDTAEVNFNFLDQKRVQLANGSYNLELTIKDNNDPNAKPYSIKQLISLEYYNNIASVSDIELVTSFEPSDDSKNQLYKNGFIVIPYTNNFYPSGSNRLRFYAEIYNTNKIMGESAYLLSYFIRSYESKKVLSDFTSFKKQSPQPVNVIIGEFPISALPSGNYELVVEVRNQKNEFITGKELFFQRSNTIFAPSTAGMPDRNIESTFVAGITGTDTLTNFIKSTRPLADQLELTFIDNQVELADTKLMQQFLYDFWAKRNPIDPAKAFSDYNAEVRKVNHSYTTSLNPGYDTERGRVYLQYGAPNTMSKNYNEPSAYPYEIWHYYKLEGQTNRRFVFYNPDLVSNEFILLHSDARGEIYNYQWENELHSRDSQSRDLDQEGLENSEDYFGNRAKDNFTNPR
jgi:GWxTD domain-containing protein